MIDIAKWFGVNPADVAEWSVVEYAECLTYQHMCNAEESEPQEELWQGR